jgi:hypothetical protein
LYRDLPEAGGLLSYGPNQTAAYRVKGSYTGRIGLLDFCSRRRCRASMTDNRLSAPAAAWLGRIPLQRASPKTEK